MQELRIALVGCGGVARRYRKAYARFPGVKVAAAIDENIGEAEAAAQETGAAGFSARFEDALGPGIDAVVVSTPNRFHRDHAVAALSAGKGVLLQKPMARSTEECEGILAAQRGSGAKLGIYMNLLDHPLFRDLRRMVAGGYLGRVVLFSARLAHRGGLGWPGAGKNWRASKEATGGGSFIQLGVHYQHLMRWLLGSRVARVQAFSRNVACPHLEGDDLTLAQYELDCGALGDIQTGWCAQEEHVSMLGTKGSIHYRENRVVEYTGEGGAFDGEAIHLRGDGRAESFECPAPEWDDAGNPYNQHRRFVEALAAGGAPEVSGEDGREDVRITEACYRAAERGRAVSL
jgi:predicted dehydrogenase